MAASIVCDEIASISLFTLRPLLLHFYVAPFIFLYGAWLYVWAFVYGIEEYYEAGLIALAVIGILQILTVLFCLWFVEVRCLLTCSKVSAF